MEKTIHPSYGCPRCLEIFDWNLLGACASVGIEHGISTKELASQFMLSYHREHDGL
jgi:hypothetical protein